MSSSFCQGEQMKNGAQEEETAWIPHAIGSSNDGGMLHA